MITAPGKREEQRDEEVEEAGRERLVRAHADAAEEADEERLAHRQPVQRERNEHDEEEQWAEDVVDAGIEVDSDGLRGGPDREDPHRLHGERHGQHPPEQPGMAPVVVDAL